MSEDLFAHGFEKWESRYAEMPADQWAFGEQATDEVKFAAQFYRQTFGDSPALTLDLGAGDGRNTLYLASQGFQVRAIEATESGCKRLRERLQGAGLSGEVEQADLRDYHLPEKIDLLVASHIIHLLPNPYEVLRTWMKHTQMGGVAVVSTRGRFAHDPDFYWFPQVFELKHIFQYKGWQILFSREEEHIHPQYTLMRRTVVVAQKPA